MVREGDGLMVGDGSGRGPVAAGGGGRPGGAAGSDPESGGLAVAAQLGGAAGDGAGYAGAHVAGHLGVTLACPVSCLGLRTVGDLVRLLEEAGRLARLSEVEHPAGLVTHRHPRGVVSLDCPLECLALPVRTANRLHYYRESCRTVGDLLRLLQSGDLLNVQGIGAGTVAEIRRVFVLAGINPDDWQPTDKA